jgi:hypothetical protein
MSYDVILLARNTLNSSEFAPIQRQLQSIADALGGALFVASDQIWTKGQRVGTLALGDTIDLTSPVWKQLAHLTDEAGIDLYDPQTRSAITPVQSG